MYKYVLITLQNGFVKPELTNDLIKHVSTTYSQKKKLLNKVRELEAEVQALESENQHLSQVEKENFLRLAQGQKLVPNLYQRLGELAKAATLSSIATPITTTNPSTTAIPSCMAVPSSSAAPSTPSTKSASNAHIAQPSIKCSQIKEAVPIVGMRSILSPTVSQSSGIIPSSSIGQTTTPTLVSAVQTVVQSSLNSSKQDLKAKNLSLHSLLEASALQREKNKDSNIKAIVPVMAVVENMKPVKEIALKPVNGVNQKIISFQGVKDGVPKPSLPVSIPLGKVKAEEGQTKPSLPVSIPLDKARLDDMQKNKSIPTTKEELTRAERLLAMYSPISRSSSVDSTDTAEESGHSSSVSNVGLSPANSLMRNRSDATSANKSNPSGRTINSYIKAVVKDHITGSSKQGSLSLLNHSKSEDKTMSQKLNLAEALIQMSEAHNHVKPNSVSILNNSHMKQPVIIKRKQKDQISPSVAKKPRPDVYQTSPASSSSVTLTAGSVRTPGSESSTQTNSPLFTKAAVKGNKKSTTNRIVSNHCVEENMRHLHLPHSVLNKKPFKSVLF